MKKYNHCPKYVGIKLDLSRIQWRDWKELNQNRISLMSIIRLSEVIKYVN
jgi:hypothetical protein